MKTATVLLMVVALSLLLVGCASNEKRNPYLGQERQIVPTQNQPHVQGAGCGFAAVDAEEPAVGGVVGVAL